jgi:hypothetical protein
MTLAELLKENKLARAIVEECKAPHRQGPDFCKIIFFKGLPGDGAPIGMTAFLQEQFPENWEELRDYCRNIAPGCSNGEDCEHKAEGARMAQNYAPEIPPDAEAEAAAGRPYVDILITDWLKLPDNEKQRNWHLRRSIQEFKSYRRPDKFTSLLGALREAGGGPAPEFFTADGWHTPDGKLINDAQEPLFIVSSIEDVKHFARELHFDERWRNGLISRWYRRNAFYVVDAETRKELMSMHLTKYTATGALSWKPVVMTFTDSELERKLSQVCTQVVTVLPVKDHDYLSDVRAFGPKEIKEAVALSNDDMSLECLDGWLGEVCRTRMLNDFPVAYAWPALLSAASVLVTKDLIPAEQRANLYVGLIGPVESGKTSAFNAAFRLLGLKDDSRAETAANELVRLKAGSGEGLAYVIGDQHEMSKLVFVDELKHLLIKLNYTGATFAELLNDIYYRDVNRLVVAGRKEIMFSCRMSLAGGVPEDGFAETFGAGTTGGLHSRFLFGVCPSNHIFSYRPLSGELSALNRSTESEYGEPIENPRPSRVEISADAWAETRRWRTELKLNGRNIELAVKAAMIAAAFDNRGTLTAAQLGPALAFAKYQENMHRRFEPNPGKNGEAIVADNVLRYLRERGQLGEWLNRRKMLHDINAYREGPGTANRALSNLAQFNEIELGKVGRQQTIRLCLDKQ